MIDRLIARLGRAYAQMPLYYRIKLGMPFIAIGGILLTPAGLALGLPDILAFVFGNLLFVALIGACLLFAKWRHGVSDEQFQQFWAAVTTTDPDVEEEHYQFARQKGHVLLILMGGCGGALAALLIGGTGASLFGLGLLGGWSVAVLAALGFIGGLLLTARALCRRYPDLPVEVFLARWARRIVDRGRR